LGIAAATALTRRKIFFCSALLPDVLFDT